MPGFGPITQGLAGRMGGGGPPAPGPAQGPQMGMEGPPMAGGDPMERLANALGEARMAIGEMGPQRFPEVKPLLKGFVGSIARLQEGFAGGGAPQMQGNPQMGPPGMPPGGAPMPPPGMPPGPQMMGPR